MQRVIYLSGAGRTWTSSCALWTAALKIAIRQGWTPGGITDWQYGTNTCFAPEGDRSHTVTAQDASALAGALSAALEATPDADGSPWLFRRRFRDRLSSLIDLCSQGEFRVL